MCIIFRIAERFTGEGTNWDISIFAALMKQAALFYFRSNIKVLLLAFFGPFSAGTWGISLD